jgi:hypothetical protein
MEDDPIGQASSMGRKRREHTKPEEEGVGAVTLAAALG